MVSRRRTSFAKSLNGDLEPKWTEVWSHINLGKIFDVSDQRDRAVNEYRQAVRTKDNTQGALEEAGKYINEKYRAAAIYELRLAANETNLTLALSTRVHSRLFAAQILLGPLRIVINPRDPSFALRAQYQARTTQ